LDRVIVRWQGVEVANVTGLPVTGGRVAVPLPGATLEAGDTASVELVVDLDANAPQGLLELSVPASGLVGFDANRGTPVMVLAEDGAELPLVSGLTRLDPPARELRVDFESRMPVALAADGREVLAGVLRVRNPAAPGGDTILVERLVLRAVTRAGAPLAIGAGAAIVEAWSGGAPWATSAALTVDSTTATLQAAAPLAIAPTGDVPLELRFRTVVSNPPLDLRIGLDSAGVEVRQPSSALLRIEIRPEPGRTFPQWTEAGAFGAM